MRIQLSTPLRVAAAGVFIAAVPPAGQAQEAGCSESAHLLRYACEFDVTDDFFTAEATCLDNTVVDEACITDAEDELDEAKEECSDIHEARIDLCEALEDAIHEPAFGEAFADDFVDPRDIGGAVAPNPYFPLVAGNRWVYEGDGETVEVTVTGETKLIDGIRCVTVTDIVSEDGVLIEDTDDWFAQDLDGNVWYCGEIALNYESFDGDDPEEPELVDIDGSWKAGRDTALPGILLPFDPEVGAISRQEVLFGDAEDAIEILSVTASETAPAGACVETCLVTLDFTPLEPDSTANKYYAPGIGLIVELEEGARIELVEFTGVSQ